LFFLDTDILLPPGTLTGIRASLAPGSFVTLERVVESVPAQRVEGPYIQEIAYKLEFIRPAGRAVLLEMSRTRFTDGSRGAQGLILLARADFLQINGMNSKLEGWGWEDLDLIARLELGLDLRRLNVGSAIHLSHQGPPQASAKADRASSERLNFSRCLNNYLAGNLLGTYREDVARWEFNHDSSEHFRYEKTPCHRNTHVR
jgi:hypothetical protein